MPRTEKKKRRSLIARVAYAFIWLYIKLLYRPKILYFEPARKKEGYGGGNIIIANHTNYRDALLFIIALAGMKPYTIVAKDWYEKGLLGKIMGGNRCIPADRFGLDTGWIRESAAILRAGGNIIVFPEGHTEKTAEMEPYKSGFLMLAALSGAKIVTAHHDRTYRLFRAQHILLDEPVSLSLSPAALTADNLEKEAEKFRARTLFLETYKEKKLYPHSTPKGAEKQ